MPRYHKAMRGDQWSAVLAAALPQSPASLSDWMTQETRLIKQDMHSRVGLLELEGRRCFLKLYLTKSPLQRAGHYLNIARGLRAYDAASSLCRLGISVPEPLACLRVSEGILLLTQGFPGGRNMSEILRSEATSELMRALLQTAGVSLAALHKAGFTHGDCKWSNLLWVEDRLYFVDLERTGETRLYSVAKRRHTRAKRSRDVARFTADAERFGLSSSAFASFIDGYCEGVGCQSEALRNAVRPPLESIRQRHLRRYGQAYPSSLL